MEKNKPTVNDRLKSFREHLKINQLEFAKSLEMRQSYYSEVESGKRKLGAKVIEKLRINYNVSGDWLSTGKGDMYLPKTDNESTPQNVPSMSLLTKKNEIAQIEQPEKQTFKATYGYKFRQLLKKNRPDLDTMLNDASDIVNIDDVTNKLYDSKIGKALFFGIGNFKNLQSYKEFKALGFQTLSEALPYKDILHEYAEATRKFVKELSQVKDEINMDFDFEDYFETTNNDTN